MITAIADLEREQAAGVLARAALSLEYAEDLTELPAEVELRQAVIAEARRQLGLSSDDNSEEAIEKIGDFLDDEADRLSEEVDTDAALRRLAESGELPSDLYEIEIIPNIKEVYGKNFEFETKIIETTIRAPTIEQHYGADRRAHEPALISLFVKHFRTRYYLKDFYMLVAGGRNGFVMNVHQAWRLYPSRMTLAGPRSPVEWLRKFADQYGLDVDVNGKKGNFFLYEENVTQHNIHLPVGRHVYLSRFGQKNPDTGLEQAALIVSIDLKKYQRTLDEMMVDKKDILEPFVEARSAHD